MFQSNNPYFNAVKDFHAKMDRQTQESPQAYAKQTASHRAGFKVEELVEFLHAATDGTAEFQEAIAQLHQAVDIAAAKVGRKGSPQTSLLHQADALIDLLYFTYGSFVLMGVDPEPLFYLVHRANMGKFFPDGKAHFDPVTHKILKPHDWEERYAPEPALQAALEQQMRERAGQGSEKGLD